MSTDVVEETGMEYYFEKHLSNPDTMEALAFLNGGGADSPNTICLGMSNAVATEFIEELLAKGAERVFLSPPQKDEDPTIRTLMIIELSTDPVRRQRIFDFMDFDAILHCGCSEPDEGQTHIFYVLHHHECDCGNELEED